MQFFRASRIWNIYIVPEFAKKYLNKKVINKIQLEEIRQKNNKLIGALENLQGDIHLKEKNHPLSFFPNTNSEKISTIYMLNFIEASKKNNYDDMEKFYDAATKASPKFSDIYKVAAYLYGKSRQDSKAMENYSLALEYVETEDDKAYIKNLFALYLMNIKSNYEEAKKYILEAIKQMPNNPNFLANYARVLKFEKNFDEALIKVDELLNSSIETPEYLKKKLYSEYADINVRKMEFIYDEAEKYEILTIILKFIDTISYDYFSFQLYKVFSKVLKNMLFLDSRRSIKMKIKLFIDKYFPYILFVENNNPDFKYTIESLNKIIDHPINIENYCCQFSKEENGTIEKINREKGYGFLSLKKWSTGFFFHFSQLKIESNKVETGEKVSFIPYFKNGKWSAISINLIEDKDEED